MGRIDDIMCDDITCKDLHLASVARMDDIPYDDVKYDDLNPECVGLWDGLMIEHAKIYILRAWLGWTIYHVTI